jgi:ribosomal protein L40E
MSAVQCLSCEHANPSGAKFCQECGSALNLKLCKQCEAVNQIKAEQCHKCGTRFAAEKTEVAAKASSGSRGPRVRAVALAAGVLALLAGLAYHFVYRQPADAPVSVVHEPAPTPPAPAPTPPAPAPTLSALPVATVVEKKPVMAVVERKPAATPAPRGVTHTRPAASATAPARPVAPPAPARDVATERALAQPAAPAPRDARSSPPVTHTKRAVGAPPLAAQPAADKPAVPVLITTETKRESN